MLYESLEYSCKLVTNVGIVIKWSIDYSDSL